MEHVLLLPHIRIQNANALSSPFTIGFPAMTAWLGAAHALQRELNHVLKRQQENTIHFDGVGVVSHHFNLQTYRGLGDYEYSIVGTSNPLDKTGSRPSFIEEARCHLEVSLIIVYQGITKLQEQEVIDHLIRILSTKMKMAGGDILSFDEPIFIKSFQRLISRVMPGYALIERRELMIEAMEQGQDALEALIGYLAINHHCEQQEKNGEMEVHWVSRRKETGSDGKRGWIVPIATGFHGISKIGKAANQRDPDTPHRFAEAVVTLGEFRMPYKLQSLEDLLWHYQYDSENSLYLCQQTRINTQDQFLEHEF